MPGPVPKRSDERVRRNTVEGLERIEVDGSVPVPELGIVDAEPMVEDLYWSMEESAQARFFEPSDWQMARLLMSLLDKELKRPSVRSVMVQTILSGLADLLVTEGARRRLRLEIDRGTATAEDSFDVAKYFEERAQAAAR